MGDVLRPQDIVVEARLAQLRQLDRLVGHHQSADRLMLHVFRPGIIHVPFLVGAVAFLIEPAVEIEIDALRGDGLAEQDAALAVGEVGDRRERVPPEVVLGRRVIDEVEDLFDFLVGRIHLQHPACGRRLARWR